MATKNRTDILRQILSQSSISTQEDIAQEFTKRGYDITQSTISRSLRRLGAVRAFDEQGRSFYRIPDSDAIPPPLQAALSDLVKTIQSNASLIVIHTTPGSASLVARHLDHLKPGGILGTIAGDDTIFVAPSSSASIPSAIHAIQASLA